jgi:large subunit ribosomal protein L6
MSRLGKKPISIEKNVQINILGNEITLKGVKGNLNIRIPDELSVINKNNEIILEDKSKRSSNLLGLYRSLILNAQKGVMEGWKKTLELIGVGYRANISGNDLMVSVGYINPVKIHAPDGISFEVNDNKITVIGIDKYLVGEVAASIRRVKPPEPYKGKGIRYSNEHIRKKLGKAAKAVGGAAGK